MPNLYDSNEVEYRPVENYPGLYRTPNGYYARVASSNDDYGPYAVRFEVTSEEDPNTRVTLVDCDPPAPDPTNDEPDEDYDPRDYVEDDEDDQETEPAPIPVSSGTVELWNTNAMNNVPNPRADWQHCLEEIRARGGHLSDLPQEVLDASIESYRHSIASIAAQTLSDLLNSPEWASGGVLFLDSDCSPAVVTPLRARDAQWFSSVLKGDGIAQRVARRVLPTWSLRRQGCWTCGNWSGTLLYPGVQFNTLGAPTEIPPNLLRYQTAQYDLKEVGLLAHPYWVVCEQCRDVKCELCRKAIEVTLTPEWLSSVGNPDHARCPKCASFNLGLRKPARLDRRTVWRSKPWVR